MNSQPRHIGRRIAIWGAPGAGKSTLARTLADALHLDVVELDGLRHARGWDSVPNDEVRAVLVERLDRATNGWVIDGNFSAMHSTYLPRIDTLLCLQYPLWLTFSRLLKRTVRRGLSRKPLYVPGGPVESLSRSLMSDESILWYALRTHAQTTARRKARLAALPPRVAVHVLTSPRQLQQLLTASGIEARTPSSPSTPSTPSSPSGS